MKKLWNILAFIALVNLFALVGFVAWLGSTDRLSIERLRKIREMLVVTKAEEALVAEQTQKEAVKTAADEKERKRFEGTPESAADQIDRQAAAADAKAQSQVRLKREQEDLRRVLEQERAALDQQKAELAAERKAFEAARAEAEKTAVDEQFKQALATLEAQKPKDAQAVLKQLIDAQRQEQAIAYLAAMADRPRAKIIAEFIKSDEKLAAGLLEQLRLRGITGMPKAAAQAP